jgi:hypothetical protein
MCAQVFSLSRAGANAGLTQLLIFMSDGEDGGSGDERKKIMKVNNILYVDMMRAYVLCTEISVCCEENDIQTVIK